MPRLHRVIVLGAAGALAITVRASDGLPRGFQVTTYAEGLVAPVALAMADDGRLFVSEKNGAIRVVEPGGALREAPFATLEVNTIGENGLLGLTLDPNFAANGRLYVMGAISPQEQHIVRFTDVDGFGADPFVIRASIPAGMLLHSGGGLAFGPDGKLYFSVGDTTDAEAAQDLKSLAGKLCRINPDGNIPDDNPFLTPTGSPRAVYALGFRNPFRFSFAPDGRLFVFDVGSDNPQRREEINLVRAGDNCGWPLVEGSVGRDEHPDLVYPLFEYTEQGQAITGGVYYTGDQFPAEYRGALFHLEFVYNRVFVLTFDGDQVAGHELFAEVEDGPVDITQGPDGSLYFSEIYTGTVKRIQYVGDVDAGPDEPTGAEVAGEVAEAPSDATPPPAPLFCGFGVVPAALLSTVALVRRRFPTN